MRKSLVAFFALAFVACISKVDADPDTVLSNPNDTTETVSTTSDVVVLCGTICDALIDEYGVPSNLRSACVYECAVGFDRAPEACYQLVACVADRSLCTGNDISASCLERTGECLPHWSLANGSCRNCWQPSRTVRGKQIVTYLSDGNPSLVPKPEDFSKLEIAALLPRATLPPYRFLGTGNADGTYAIKGVPGCGAWIQVGTTYTWATNADVDTSYSVQGRTGFTVAGPDTTFVINAQNLVPWTDEDWFYFFSPQVQVFNGYLPPYDPTDVGLYVPPGSTSGRFTMFMDEQGLPDPAQNDVAYVQQLSAKAQADGSFVRTVTRSAKLTSFAPVSGQPNPVSVDLVPVTPTENTRIEFKRSTFEALQGDLHAASQRGFSLSAGARGSLAIWAHPGRERRGATGELVLIDRQSSDGDIPAIDVAWGNPYDPTWGVDVYAGVLWFVMLTDRNGLEYRAVEEISVTEPFDRWNKGPVTARVSPPRNVRVDGQPANTARAGSNLSLTPTISWERPTLGEPEVYEVTVHTLADGSTRFASRPRVTATFLIPRIAGGNEPALKSVTLPPGVLERGRDYHFSVTSAVRKQDERNDAATVVTSEYRP